MLTLFRVCASPFILFFLTLKTEAGYWTANGLFLLAAITDFLDGFWARNYGSPSRLGQLLDPLADKILVIPCLIMLVSLGTLTGLHMLVVIFIVVRDIMVPTLRERFLETQQKPLCVTEVARLKTACLMFAVFCLMAGLAPAPAAWLKIVKNTGLFFLDLSAIFSAVSLLSYLKKTLKQL